MAVSIEKCEQYQKEIFKRIEGNTKLIEQNIDLTVIPEIDSEWRYKAYARLKKSQERKKLISFLLKIISEISAIGGAITVIAQIFLGTA